MILVLFHPGLVRQNIIPVTNKANNILFGGSCDFIASESCFHWDEEFEASRWFGAWNSQVISKDVVCIYIYMFRENMVEQ